MIRLRYGFILTLVLASSQIQALTIDGTPGGEKGILSFAARTRFVVYGKVVNKDPIRRDSANSYVGFTVAPIKCLKGGKTKKEIRSVGVSYRVVFVHEKGNRDPVLKIGEEYVFFLNLNLAFTCDVEAPIFDTVVILTKDMLQAVDEAVKNNEPFLEIVRVHRIKKGDALYSLVMQHYDDSTMVDRVAEFNKLKDKNVIREGSYLIFPTKAYFKELEKVSEQDSARRNKKQSKKEREGT